MLNIFPHIFRNQTDQRVCEGKFKPGVRRKDRDGGEITSFVDLQLHLLDSEILTGTLRGHRFQRFWISSNSRESEREIYEWESEVRRVILTVHAERGREKGLLGFSDSVCIMGWIVDQKKPNSSFKVWNKVSRVTRISCCLYFIYWAH